MSAAEKLARLTAGSSWKVERLDPSVTELPTEVLAGALPSNPLQQAILMAKFMHTNRHEAYNHCRTEFSHTIRKNRWEIPSGVEVYRAICRLAVDEVIDEPLCPRCQGRTEVWLKGHNTPITCNLCDGSGKRSITESKRYRLVRAMPYQGLHQITEEDWFSRWRHRSYAAFRLAQNAHNEGVIHMQKELAEIW